jgi:hypothetical protein
MDHRQQDVHEGAFGELIPGYYDIALRDFGLLLGALTLARLATAFEPARRGF